jgi:hypothetical protein
MLSVNCQHANAALKSAVLSGIVSLKEEQLLIAQ